MILPCSEDFYVIPPFSHFPIFFFFTRFICFKFQVKHDILIFLYLILFFTQFLCFPSMSREMFYSRISFVHTPFHMTFKTQMIYLQPPAQALQNHVSLISRFYPQTHLAYNSYVRCELMSNFTAYLQTHMHLLT